MPAKPALLAGRRARRGDGGVAVRRAGHGQVPHGSDRLSCSRTCGPARSARTRASRGSRCTPARPSSTTPATPAGTPSASSRPHVRTIPVLGNGDIWVADDALAMIRHTGCDGVVIGRGCLGRPWLFGDLIDVFNGRPAPPSRPLGVVIDVMADHGRMLAEHHGRRGTSSRRCATSASTPRGTSPAIRSGPEVRRNFAPGVVARRARRPARAARPHDHRRRRAARRSAVATPTARSRCRCPQGFLDDPDALEHDVTVPDDNDVMALSGG